LTDAPRGGLRPPPAQRPRRATRPPGPAPSSLMQHHIRRTLLLLSSSFSVRGTQSSAQRPPTRALAVPRAALLSLDPRKRRTTGMKKGMEESYVEDLASHDGPAHALAFREGAAKRWCRGARRPAIAASKWARLGCRRAVDQRKATSVAAFSRAVIGPRGVGEPVHVRDLFMLRTGRSHGHPPVVMEGRVVRGTPMAVIP
jgi:hypothetical protein